MIINSNKFLGRGFQDILAKHKIRGFLTTVKNAQSNGICERMHQTMLNILKVYAKTQMINTYKDAQHVIDHAIATSIHATCCAVNHTMQHSPGEIVFQRDMLLDIPVIAGLVAIRERRQLLIDENLRRQNEKRI